mgnify:CR=1 FL=1
MADDQTLDTHPHPRPCRWCDHHEPGWCRFHDTPVSAAATCTQWVPRANEPQEDDHE